MQFFTWVEVFNWKDFCAMKIKRLDEIVGQTKFCVYKSDLAGFEFKCSFVIQVIKCKLFLNLKCLLFCVNGREKIISFSWKDLKKFKVQIKKVSILIILIACFMYLPNTKQLLNR